MQRDEQLEENISRDDDDDNNRYNDDDDISSSTNNNKTQSSWTEWVLTPGAPVIPP